MLLPPNAAWCGVSLQRVIHVPSRWIVAGHMSLWQPVCGKGEPAPSSSALLKPIWLGSDAFSAVSVLPSSLHICGPVWFAVITLEKLVINPLENWLFAQPSSYFLDFLIIITYKNTPKYFSLLWMLAIQYCYFLFYSPTIHYPSDVWQSHYPQ